MKEFNINTVICHGTGALKKLNEITGKNVLIVCDAFISSSEIMKKVVENLKENSLHVYDKIIPDPTVEVVAKGLQIMQNESIDVIVAVGGGSSIDGAKAVSEYYRKLNNNSEKKVKFYAIPTTSGTGSEVTEYSVITNERENLKYALTSKEILPDVAILDAELVKSVPRSITADTGMDVITHAIEAYVSKEATDFTDALAEKAFVLAIENIEKVCNDGADLKGREKMHNASCLAGMAFNSAGLGLVHSLAHAIGGKLHIPHGKINAMILPYVIRANSRVGELSYLDKADEVTLRYQNLAKMIGINVSNPVLAINKLVAYIFELNKRLGIPATLKELGKDTNLIIKEEIYAAVMKDVCTKTNPREVTNIQVNELLLEIIG
ncbi:1-propanol dehydrogenase PduQ [Fusobacterium sp.]|uniref:1-propanol dehydrogenase PduQ n=1 Tax=Fusobacterium sp. TaxID=68766 RepID=UPI0026155CE9|nr:1-propanol dehydrogenase PduQ [Fusobacterium sp.]